MRGNEHFDFWDFRSNLKQIESIQFKVDEANRMIAQYKVHIHERLVSERKRFYRTRIKISFDVAEYKRHSKAEIAKVKTYIRTCNVQIKVLTDQNDFMIDNTYSFTNPATWNSLRYLILPIGYRMLCYDQSCWRSAPCQKSELGSMWVPPCVAYLREVFTIEDHMNMVEAYYIKHSEEVHDSRCVEEDLR